MPNLNLPASAAAPRSQGRFDQQPSATTRSNASVHEGSHYALEGRSPPGRATEELARFFREKANRGDEPLTAVEQAGVFHLMQQGTPRSYALLFQTID